MRRSFTLAALTALLASFPMGASAEVYSVTLTNGSVLETQYQPQEASFDKDMVLLLTEVGNWIGVRRDEIEAVVSDAESSGFGKVIGKNTVDLGWAANDAADPNAPGADKQDPGLSLAAQALQAVYQQRQAAESYTIKQFVQPSETQGIPAGLIGQSSPPK
ncbi:MAG: hypothetical protein QOH06_2412 [Acidobacteriota bacterium]|jgi:hypothetical protein|nr:hypothetical protein [Acidobacteriota bacterium]